MDKLNVVILAAGKGTRMRSAIPKVLHELAGSSMLQHALNKAEQLRASKVQVVLGHEAELVKQSLVSQKIDTVLQEPQLGTAHAVHQALPYMEADAMVLVLYGDVPLIKLETLRALISLVDKNSMAVLTCKMKDPSGLGRIVRNEAQEIIAIVEEKDASDEQKAIKEINTGIMAMPVAKLHDCLPRIGAENAQKEYYLTDLIKLAIEDGCRVLTHTLVDEIEASGVNDRKQLANLERHYQIREAERIMLEGVSFRDPARFDLRGQTTFAEDVVIDINVILEGINVISTGVSIGPNCILKNSMIGPNTIIAANTIIEDAVVGSNCSIGPFARIRPGTQMAEGAKIGNFVEVKKTTIGKGSKINHLSYIGDSAVGENVNIGAGTITCNYDGANKHLTTIGDDVFIGSNSALVAPVTVGNGANIAAGSVITEDVESKQLALARSRQVNKDGWQRPEKNK